MVPVAKNLAEIFVIPSTAGQAWMKLQPGVWAAPAIEGHLIDKRPRHGG
jgi:hypothetical protein